MKNKVQIPAEVSAYMAGRHALIMGGDRRRSQLTRLQNAFPNTRFTWISGRKTDASLERFRPRIVDPTVSLVIALNGLLRTGNVQGARQLCSALNKPLFICWRPTVVQIIAALRRRGAVGCRPEVNDPQGEVPRD